VSVSVSVSVSVRVCVRPSGRVMDEIRRGGTEDMEIAMKEDDKYAPAPKASHTHSLPFHPVHHTSGGANTDTHTHRHRH